MIKKLLIAAVALVVLIVAAVAAAAFMAPTDFRVERETTIDRPKAEIYSYARLLRNQNDWGPWFRKEPTMHQEFRGTDGEVGFVSYWKGSREEVGEGEQEIMRLTPDQRIDTQLRFKQPFESQADAYMILEPVSDSQTKVKWGFTGAVPRPMNVVMLAMDMDKEVGKDFEEGLASLKKIVESK